MNIILGHISSAALSLIQVIIVSFPLCIVRVIALNMPWIQRRKGPNALRTKIVRSDCDKRKKNETLVLPVTTARHQQVTHKQ